MKVLIPVEDALFGSAIVRFVSKHEWQPGTEFHVMNVVEPYLSETMEIRTPHAPMAALFAVSEKQIMSSANELVGKVAESIRSIFPSLLVEQSVIKGHIKDEIIAYARENAVDLIIAGSHGRSGFQRFFLGSVSLMLVSEATCSVLLIKPDDGILTAWSKIERHIESCNDELFKQLSWEMEKVDSKRILLALDETPVSDQIIDFVLKHKWTQPAHFQLLNVIQNPEHGIFPASPALKEWYADAKETRRAALRRFALKLRDQYHSTHIEESLLEGEPKQTIVEAARLWGADLIVVGSRYHKSLQRLSIGSVSMAVLCTAPCPVLLLKEPTQSGASDVKEIENEKNTFAHR